MKEMIKSITQINIFEQDDWTFSIYNSNTKKSIILTSQIWNMIKDTLLNIWDINKVYKQDNTILFTFDNNVSK